MPPLAIASSEVVSIVMRRSLGSCSTDCAIRSRLIVDGNFGAPPNPPQRESKLAANCSSPSSTTSNPGTSASGVTSAVRRNDSVSAVMFCLMSSGRVRHTSSIAPINCMNWAFGKYVPP